MGRGDASESSELFGADDGGLLVLRSEWQPSRQQGSDDDQLWCYMVYLAISAILEDLGVT